MKEDSANAHTTSVNAKSKVSRSLWHKRLAHAHIASMDNIAKAVGGMYLSEAKEKGYILCDMRHREIKKAYL